MQSILKPYEGELDCYPVSNEVGKVGNDSASFIVPIDSKENKNNIANFFASAKSKQKPEVKQEDVKVKHEPDEHRATVDEDGIEDNAPKPVPAESKEDEKWPNHGAKRSHSPDNLGKSPDSKVRKTLPEKRSSPVKTLGGATGRKTRSATSNGTVSKPTTSKKGGDGSQQITNFFSK